MYVLLVMFNLIVDVIMILTQVRSAAAITCLELVQLVLNNLLEKLAWNSYLSIAYHIFFTDTPYSYSCSSSQFPEETLCFKDLSPYVMHAAY